MAERNLTYEEWSRLSEKEKGKRYQELSEHDKFRVRISMYPAFASEDVIVVFTIGDLLSALRFQDGTTKEHRNKVDKDPETPCANGLKYRKKEIS